MIAAAVASLLSGKIANAFALEANLLLAVSPELRRQRKPGRESSGSWEHRPAPSSGSSHSGQNPAVRVLARLGHIEYAPMAGPDGGLNLIRHVACCRCHTAAPIPPRTCPRQPCLRAQVTSTRRSCDVSTSCRSRHQHLHKNFLMRRTWVFTT